MPKAYQGGHVRTGKPRGPLGKRHTSIVLPPGEVIREDMRERKMTIAAFATQADLPLADAKKLLSGRLEITVEIAECLARVFGVFSAAHYLALDEKWRKFRTGVLEKEPQ